MKKQSFINIIVFVISAFLIAGMSTASCTKQNPVEVYIKGGDIFYSGRISPDGYSLLREKAEAAAIKPARLVINSSGSPVENGLDIGNWLYDNGLDIMVVDKCMSSCANYIFPAAKNKEISDGAVVAWHGSLSDLLADSELEESLKFVDRQHPGLTLIQREKMKEQARISFAQYRKAQAVRQKEFFKKIGVDESVTMLGPSYGVEDFYALSIKDMKSFGITNVKAPVNYAKTDLSKFRKIKPITFVALKESAHDPLLSTPSVQGKSSKNIVIYVSSTGAQLTAYFDGHAGSVTLNLPDGRTVSLPRAISGSGARYASGSMVFWEHQGEASVWIDEKLIFKGTPASKIP